MLQSMQRVPQCVPQRPLGSLFTVVTLGNPASHRKRSHGGGGPVWRRPCFRFTHRKLELHAKKKPGGDDRSQCHYTRSLHNNNRPTYLSGVASYRSSSLIIPHHSSSFLILWSLGRMNVLVVTARRRQQEDQDTLITTHLVANERH